MFVSDRRLVEWVVDESVWFGGAGGTIRHRDGTERANCKLQLLVQQPSLMPFYSWLWPHCSRAKANTLLYHQSIDNVDGVVYVDLIAECFAQLQIKFVDFNARVLPCFALVITPTNVFHILSSFFRSILLSVLHAIVYLDRTFSIVRCTPHYSNPDFSFE